MSEETKVEETKVEGKKGKEKKVKPEMTVADIRAEIEELGGELPAASENKEAQMKALEKVRKKMGIKNYVSEGSEKQASTISQTFKLGDRRVIDVESGDVYANPRQLWKAGPLNRGVKGRVAAQLYSAAREGKFPVIEAKGEDGTVCKFQLVMGYVAENPDFDPGEPVNAIGARIPAPKKEKPAKKKKAGKKANGKDKKEAPEVSDEQAALDAAAVDKKIADAEGAAA